MILRAAKYLRFGETIRLDPGSVWIVREMLREKNGRLTFIVHNRFAVDVHLTIFLVPDDLVEIVS